MTLRDWLAHREPSPPRVLRERVEALALEASDQSDPSRALLAAAEVALARLSALPAGDRSAALDLLAIDALVTYAFEYAADSPGAIPALAAGAMTRLSAVPPS